MKLQDLVWANDRTLRDKALHDILVVIVRHCGIEMDMAYVNKNYDLEFCLEYETLFIIEITPELDATLVALIQELAKSRRRR